MDKLKKLKPDNELENVSIVVEKTDPSQERVLSEFDRMMLKAINYNHSKKIPSQVEK